MFSSQVVPGGWLGVGGRGGGGGDEKEGAEPTVTYCKIKVEQEAYKKKNEALHSRAGW